jgi:hypothetical protein
MLTIKYVTSGFSLVAFAAVVALYAYRRALASREASIKSASAADRPALVMATLEFFDVDAGRLTKDQAYNLALAQIEARSRRYFLNVLVLAPLAVVTLAIAIFANRSAGSEPKVVRPEPLVFSDTGDYVIDKVQRELVKLTDRDVQLAEQRILDALAPLVARPAFLFESTSSPALQLYVACRTRVIMQSVVPFIESSTKSIVLIRAIGLLQAIEVDIGKNRFPGVNVTSLIAKHINSEADFTKSLPAESNGGPGNRDQYGSKLMRTLNAIIPKIPAVYADE